MLTAAHCLEDLVAGTARKAGSAVLVARDGGIVRRPLGRIELGKTDFSHHWIALGDEDPIDVAVMTIDDGGLAAWPTAPLPEQGSLLFIAGYPRVEGRADSAQTEAGYSLNFGTTAVSFGRLADRNDDDRPMCAVDEHQENWQLKAPCPAGVIGRGDAKTWTGVILRSPFLATYDTCNGYSGGPVFDAKGQLVGVNATVLSRFNPQERYDRSMRMVATSVAEIAKRLAWPSKK